MTFLKTFTHKFVNNNDKVNAESYRKGTFFLLSVSLFLFISVFFWIFFVFYPPSGHDPALNTEMNFSNFFLCVVLAVLLVVYKKWGLRNILANTMMVLYYFGFAMTYNESGGIFSPDLTWVIIGPAWISLVANKRSGHFWFGFSILLVVFFYCAERLGLEDFRADQTKIDSNYYFLNLIFAIPLMYIVISVYQRNNEIYMQEVFRAKAEIEAQKEDILSSINYASRIQRAVLPHSDVINRAISFSFIYFKPRDIVSGDFYWFHEIDKENYIFVTADCTGHGVPGAFMTVIGSTLLNQIIVENRVTQPSQILSDLDALINSTLKQERQHENSVQDGMDLSLILVNKTQSEFTFASAKRPAIFIRDNILQEIKGSKLSLGGMRSGEKKFEEVKVSYREGDMLYLFTDGITDQFGGEKGKKFTIKRLREILLNINKFPMIDQQKEIAKNVENWMGSLEQIDDITLMGIRF